MHGRRAHERTAWASTVLQFQRQGPLISCSNLLAAATSTSAKTHNKGAPQARMEECTGLHAARQQLGFHAPGRHHRPTCVRLQACATSPRSPRAVYISPSRALLTPVASWMAAATVLPPTCRSSGQVQREWTCLQARLGD